MRTLLEVGRVTVFVNLTEEDDASAEAGYISTVRKLLASVVRASILRVYMSWLI